MALRRRSMRLALCALLIGTASAWALAPHDKAVGVHAKQVEHGRSTSENDAAKTQADQRGTAERPLVVKTISPEKSPDEAAKDARDRKNKRWNDGAAILIGAVTVLVLLIQSGIFIFQAVVFRRQAQSLKDTISAMERVGTKQSEDMRESIESAKVGAVAAQRSADVARDALVASNRSWIKITAKVASCMTFDNDGARVSIVLEYENIGFSPALNVFGTPMLNVPTNDIETRDLIKPIMERENSGDLGFTIMPKDKITETFIVNLSPKQIADGGFGRSTKPGMEREGSATHMAIDVYGIIAYRDSVSATWHHTPFAYNFIKRDGLGTYSKAGPVIAVEDLNLRQDLVSIPAID